jgi:5-formyltetrahydrofolate cyclo-ligase
MPTYPVINQSTGETKELYMPVVEYEQWRKDNPDWDKDWSKGCAGIGEVGDWKNKLISKNPGWNDVLAKASKAPGSRVKKI